MYVALARKWIGERSAMFSAAIGRHTILDAERSRFDAIHRRSRTAFPVLQSPPLELGLCGGSDNHESTSGSRFDLGCVVHDRRL
jgi:hypothetical protein